MADSVLWTDLFRLAQQEADKGDGRAIRTLERYRIAIASQDAMRHYKALYGDNPISQRDEE